MASVTCKLCRKPTLTCLMLMMRGSVVELEERATATIGIENSLKEECTTGNAESRHLCFQVQREDTYSIFSQQKLASA